MPSFTVNRRDPHYIPFTRDPSVNPSADRKAFDERVKGASDCFVRNDTELARYGRAMETLKYRGR